LDIFVIGAGPTAGACLAFGDQSGRLDPFVVLDVPIGKGDVGGLGMKGGRVIDDPIRFDGALPVQIARVAHIDPEEAVINAVASFIENDENAGRVTDIIKLQKSLIGFVTSLGEGRFSLADARGVHPAIHGDGADVDGFIRRALIDFGARIVGGHGRLGGIDQKGGIGLIHGLAHGACHPIGKNAHTVLSVGVTGEVALVIIGIIHPGHDELAHIALAGDAPGFLFDPSQSGQQHGGEDRDDRHHDQKLNKREAGGCGSACFSGKQRI